ncbi:MAG: hypothetical protein J7647_29645 [Cyanobacteria bacterium SBLK]|nr:hypothetical protein [Cyanobacteria bacterium SBLK]
MSVIERRLLATVLLIADAGDGAVVLGNSYWIGRTKRIEKVRTLKKSWNG